MRRSHFATLAPICPVCMLANRPVARLHILHEQQATAEEVIEGALTCPTCRFEYPIFDGIPIIAANVREIVANQHGALLQRQDVSPYALSFLADCLGPGSEFERDRYRLGAYAHAHWGDHVPAPAPSVGYGAAQLMTHALRQLALVQLGSDHAVATMAPAASVPAAPAAAAPTQTTPVPAPRIEGVWLDIGCGLGRASVMLAAAGAHTVAAFDLNLAMLRALRSALRTGVLPYDVRRVGVVFDRVHAQLASVMALGDRLALWAADASVIPLADHHVQGVASLNVLDCIALPANHLAEIGRVLAHRHHAIVATPFDWSPAATAFDGWLAGHSQRAPHRGSSVAEFARIVGPTDPAGFGLRLRSQTDCAWTIAVHERARMEYTPMVAVVERV